MNLTSSAFKNTEALPSQYTCDGNNISPPLQWEGAPAGTKSFALIVDDPDAPNKVWTHWVAYNIPASVTESPEGHAPSGSVQGMNDFGHARYGGPCPPSGSHRYFFRLYALDQPLALAKGATREDVEIAMRSHILEEAQLMGTYQRK